MLCGCSLLAQVLREAAVAADFWVATCEGCALSPVYDPSHRTSRTMGPQSDVILFDILCSLSYEFYASEVYRSQPLLNYAEFCRQYIVYICSLKRGRDVDIMISL